MKTFVAILLLALPASLQAGDLLKSATDAMKDSGSSQSLAVPADLDFSAGLSKAVSQGLGVTGKQADGGLGALFSLAKSSLGDEQFGSLAGAVPGMESLLEAAPALESAAGSMTGMSGGLGGYAEAASGAAAVYSRFQSLGLSTSAIPQYIGIVNSYLQSSGGQAAVDLFSKGIAALL